MVMIYVLIKVALFFDRHLFVLAGTILSSIPLCLLLPDAGYDKGYQPRTNIVKDEKGDLVADSHSILVGWRNNLSHLLNIQGLMMFGRQKYTQQYD